MPHLFDFKLNVCYTCGKPLSMSHTDCDGNLQIVPISKEEFIYDETYNIYLCNDCYIPEKVNELASL